MHQVIDFNRPFKGQEDEAAKVKRAAARVIDTATKQGIRICDLSEGTNLKIVHEGLLDLGGFIEMVYQHVDEVEAETIQ